MKGFMAALEEQRWDDHRYYHHSRINQSLHFLSSLCFVCMYVLLFFAPTVGVLLGWLVAMTSRQAGHFFFEPKGYDDVNEATHQHKEAIKVGYNLKRKVILHTVWAAVTLALILDPTFFGLFTRHQDFWGFADHLAKLWLAVAVGALLFRGIHLFFLRDVQTGLVWMTKIITDPFHDIYLYHKAPIYLMRGELIAPRPNDFHQRA
jgi:hypothetical protein